LTCRETGRNGCVKGLMTVSRSQARAQSARGGAKDWFKSHEKKEKSGTTLFPTITSNFLTVKRKENCS
jgi:hypothetical protein